jgi:hypothetical protein
MPTDIKTWQLVDGKLDEIVSTLAEEGRTEVFDLERWIESNPSIIGPDLTIIGKQVLTKSGPLDLLAIDKGGNLVVVELKRGALPRDALAQAVDYASDIADWSLEKVSEVCTKYTDKSLEDVLSETFPDIDLTGININEAQRIVLVGFDVEPSLERMVSWLSGNYSVNINAVLLKYLKTRSGDELLARTSVISEQVEQERVRRKKFEIPMSDEPGDYEKAQLRQLLRKYLSQDLYSSRRMKDVLLPVCLERGRVSRDDLRKEFVKQGQAESISQAGYFMSLISQQIGMAKNDFLRQVIGYEYPNNPWEKDNYHIRDEYREPVKEVLATLSEEDKGNVTLHGETV